MSDFLFSALGRTPDFIIGKWDPSNLSPAAKEIYGDYFSKELGQIQINKYEFWFNDTISFIPYNGQPVFITDTLGNVTHTGNLRTKGNTIINKSLTVDENVLIKNKLLVKDAVELEKTLKVSDDVRIEKDLYITGKVFSAYFDSLLAKISSAVDALSSGTTEVQSSSDTAVANSVTNITQIVQPTYDSVKITFVDSTNETSNSGEINKITYNDIVANIENGYQVGGMRSGEYVQDNKRVGIENILTSNTATTEFETNGDAPIGYRSFTRTPNNGGNTGKITLKFPKPIREFSIKAMNAGGMSVFPPYVVTFKFINGNKTTKRFELSPQIKESTIRQVTDLAAGDIEEVMLSVINPEDTTDPSYGTSFITYTNLFWK